MWFLVRIPKGNRVFGNGRGPTECSRQILRCENSRFIGKHTRQGENKAQGNTRHERQEGDESNVTRSSTDYRTGNKEYKRTGNTHTLGAQPVGENMAWVQRHEGPGTHSHGLYRSHKNKVKEHENQEHTHTHRIHITRVMESWRKT